MPKTRTKKPYLTTSQVAARIGVCSATVADWDDKGIFPAHHKTPTGRRFYTEQQVEDLLSGKNKRTHGPAPGATPETATEQSQ